MLDNSAAEPVTQHRAFFETWRGIAAALGRSERWCRYTTRRAVDPLPVFKVGGIARLNASDLEDWLIRQRDAGLTRPAPAVEVRVEPTADADAIRRETVEMPR
jgi:hypothetical protein